jgi:sec-independent protein translocase protein TatB
VFDLDFSKLILIGVVALIVIGPQKLPRVARTAGHLLGRFQRYVAEVKADINREMELTDLKKLQTSVEDAARSIEDSVKSGMEDAQKEFRDAQAALEDTGAELKKTEDAVKQAVSGVQLPQMVTTGLEQQGQSDSGSPPTDDVRAGLLSPAGPANTPGTPATESSSVATQSVQRADADDVSPQLELALDRAGEPLPRRQA